MHTEAIVLKKIPTRDFDELVVCYTKQAGKQSFRAKGALRPHSKQGRHLDVLNYVTFTAVSCNGHPIIASATCMYAYQHLKRSLPALSVVFFVLEAFDKLVYDNEYDPSLWNFLETTLAQCNTGASVVATDWKAVCDERRETLFEALGHPPRVLLEDLHPKPFSSLRFLESVIQ